MVRNEKLKLPVGIDGFEKIRRNGFYYIDKTKLIEQLFLNCLMDCILLRTGNCASNIRGSIRLFFFL